MTVTPAPNKSRAEFVYEHIREGIHNGRYARGERIREEELAQALGVSRTPVREAIARLQNRGLVEVASGGLIVVELTANEVIELYAVREILESSAARFAAQHASPWEIANLNRITDEFAAALDDPERLSHINKAFHAALSVAAHNKYLVRVLGELHDNLALLPQKIFAAPKRVQASLSEHRAIVVAIEARDAEKAEQAARLHLRHAQDIRLQMLLS